QEVGEVSRDDDGSWRERRDLGPRDGRVSDVADPPDAGPAFVRRRFDRLLRTVAAGLRPVGGLRTVPFGLCAGHSQYRRVPDRYDDGRDRADATAPNSRGRRLA